MKIEDDSRCFACGTKNQSGLKLKFRVSEDPCMSESEFTVSDNFCGWKGIVHGGIVSTILDETMVYACRGIENRVVTGEISVKFKKPVPSGQKIRSEGRIKEKRGRIIFTSGEIRSLDGELLASADAKMFITG